MLHRIMNIMLRKLHEVFFLLFHKMVACVEVYREVFKDMTDDVHRIGFLNFLQIKVKR